MPHIYSWKTEEEQHHDLMVIHAEYLKDHAEHLYDYLQERNVQDGKAVMLDDIGQIKAHLRRVEEYVKSMRSK